MTTDHHTLFARSISRRTFGIGSALTLATVGTLRTLPVLAAASTPTPALPELTLVAKEFSFELPASIPAGFTTITMENQGTGDHHAIFLKLHEGVTFDQVKATKTRGELPSLGEQLGGPVVAPGNKQSVVIDLAEGSYAVVCVITIPDGVPHYHKGMIAPLEVTAGTAEGAAPKADLNIELVEMMFHGLPDAVPVGPSTWEIANDGATTHELVVFKLDEGVTPDQVLAMLSGPPPADAPAGPPPFATFGAVSFMDAGNTAWALLDLVAGHYLALCFWDDPASGKWHGELGMVHTFIAA